MQAGQRRVVAKATGNIYTIPARRTLLGIHKDDYQELHLKGFVREMTENDPREEGWIAVDERHYEFIPK